MNFKSAIAVAFLAIVALQPPPALAQNRVFVSTQGSDSNVCSVSAPCRSFQHAHDVAVANGEIDVLDPGGYGAVNITKSISIQGHGFSGITAASGNAVAISAPEDAIINLNGLLIEGAGTGNYGIALNTVGSLNINGTMVRGFTSGGLGLLSSNTTNPTIFINVSDTIITQNPGGFGAVVEPIHTTSLISVTFNRVQAFANGGDGIFMNSQFLVGNGNLNVSIVDCVTNGNGGIGIHAAQGGSLSNIFVRVLRSVAVHNLNSGIVGDNGARMEIGQSEFNDWSGTGLISDGDNYTLSTFSPFINPRK